MKHFPTPSGRLLRDPALPLRNARRFSHFVQSFVACVTFLIVAAGTASAATWIPRNSGASSNLNMVAFGNELFVAVGDGGTILTSQDGVSWVPRSSPSASNLHAVTFGGGQFVAVGGGTVAIGPTTILTSPDGINWTSRTPVFLGRLFGVTYGNGTYVIVGESNHISTSSDGVHWTAESVTPLDADIRGVCYGGGQFVAVALGALVLTSQNAHAWTSGPSNGSNGKITYGNGLFCSAGSTFIQTSPDGVTWTRRAAGRASGLGGVSFVDGHFVVSGPNGLILVSRDGVDWFNSPTGSSVFLSSAAFGNGTFVVVGSAGTILQSAGQLLPPLITTVSPNPVPGRNSRQSFTINGASFDSNCTVTLRDRRTGLVYPNRTKVAQSSTSITLNPNFGAVAASWSVEVINPGGISTGQFAFSVQAPSTLPEITSTGLETITAGSTPQTLNLIGSGFAPNSTVQLRSLETGEVLEVVTSFVDSTRVILTTLFSRFGKWSLTLLRPDGQKSQPEIVSVTEDKEFLLSFPLLAGDPNGNKGAYKAGINTVFDHKMGKALESGNYGITTFCGDECTTPHSVAISNKNGDPLRNFLPVPSLLSQKVNYRLVVPACAYDNHAGIDYHGIDGETPVYAAAAGVLEFVRPNSPTAGNWIRIKHADSGYATGYLHLNKFAKGLVEGDKVVEGQYLGLVGKTGGVGQHLHFEVRSSTDDKLFYDPYGWMGPPESVDPYTMLTGGLVNKPLWRDLPNKAIYVFPVAFAGASDPLVGQQVTNPAIPGSGGQRTISLNTASESYTSAVAADASSWLTITSGGNGSGLSTLAFTVAQNPGSKRTGKIVVQPIAGGQRIVTVVQEAAAVTASSGAAGPLQGGSAKAASVTAAQASSNPANEEIATELKRAAQEHQIPANILAAVAYVGSAWQQFDGAGSPFVGADGRIGLLQIDTQNPVVPMDVPRVSVDWRYNIEIGCQILRKVWRNRLGDSLSPYDDENDADPAILENWFHPVAWYRGVGAPAQAFVGSVWSALKSSQAPASSYFAAVSDLGDPRALDGFPATIGATIPEPQIPDLATADPALLIAHGKSTLMILRMADQQIHRWNWNGEGSAAGAPVNITESIRTEPDLIDYETWALHLDEFSSGLLADIDGDGSANLVEFVFGTDPESGRSSPSFSVKRVAGGVEVVTAVASYHGGASLTLESSVNLIDWSPVEVDPVEMTGAASRRLIWTVPTLAPSAFVRLRVTPE